MVSEIDQHLQDEDAEKNDLRLYKARKAIHQVPLGCVASVLCEWQCCCLVRASNNSMITSSFLLLAAMASSLIAMASNLID